MWNFQEALAAFRAESRKSALRELDDDMAYVGHLINDGAKLSDFRSAADYMTASVALANAGHNSLLGCHTVSAATLESNGPMRSFLEGRQGLRCAEVVAAHGLYWWKYVRPLGTSASSSASSSEGQSSN